MKYQPPPREEGFTELPTAYAAMQVDADPHDGEEIVPWCYKITFLGIFAVPALIDIFMLTTIGRGLYLTTFMSSTDKTMATTALMIGLLTCGAAGSWISSGGSYYLYANAFPAMNMFVLIRFCAGMGIVMVGAIGGFLGASCARGIMAGVVFCFYYIMLTTYLLVLAALSIYQLPGSSFQSGRTVIMLCVPILFIAPVITIWIGHDRTVYFCLLTLFLFMLLLGARKTLSQWSTWYLKIPCVTDAEVVNWYCKTRGAMALDVGEDVDTSPLPRQELHAAVLKERNRYFWQKSTKDALVKKLADGYASTLFLMAW